MPELKSVTSTLTSTQPARKKKGPKGPNPLSVKKKKPKERLQPNHKGEALVSGDKLAAGSKRKLDQVEFSVREEIHSGCITIKEGRKRRKKDDLDATTGVQ